MKKLFLALLMSLSAMIATAQKNIIDKLYLDAELGLVSVSSETAFIGGATDLNIGYRINSQLAAGASLIFWSEPSDCCRTMASGTGLQLRYTPNNTRLIVKVESGYLLSASYADDVAVRFEKNKSSSRKYYVRTSIDWRWSKYFTTGITWAAADKQVNDYFDTNDNFVSTGTFNVRAASLHIGFTLPNYPKTK